jgi:ubiquinone/menaquinone biosynthesis C-methylase UbiE
MIVDRPREAARAAELGPFMDLLRCPVSGARLRLEGCSLVCADGAHRFLVEDGIPLFAAEYCSSEGSSQRAHYDRVAQGYVENLSYPHTEEYLRYLDRALLGVMDQNRLDTVAELCCGHGEAFRLLKSRFRRGIGVDVSPMMLKHAAAGAQPGRIAFLQGDATMLPIASDSIDSVFMLGGVHHVNNRPALFREIARVLRPGGRFYFREPVSDFWLWRLLRAVVYRISPKLDAATEQPLLYRETAPVLAQAGLKLGHWSTHGLIGFCLFMNADVLVFNRVFRFVPGIRSITRAAAKLDEWMLSLPPLRRIGLQVVGVAEKPQ